MGDIQLVTEGVIMPSLSEDKVASWLSDAILAEQKEVGEITIIFCSDPYLHKLNLEHLNHDTYTDIITFDYAEGRVVSGDLFISLDRVKDNALTFSTTLDDELHRVMIHGVLHLIGYGDKSEPEKVKMREMEDFHLSRR